jgi:hypothetical protein
MKRMSKEGLVIRYISRLETILKLALDDKLDKDSFERLYNDVYDPEQFRLSRWRMAHVTGYDRALIQVAIKKGLL